MESPNEYSNELLTVAVGLFAQLTFTVLGPSHRRRAGWGISVSRAYMSTKD